MKLNPGGITEAGLAKKNRTGDWRYFLPVIDQDKCSGCGICELFCPDSSIEIKEKRYTINLYYCKGCGICAKECPRLAITMQTERGVAI